MRQLDSTLGCVRVAIVVPRFGFSAVRRNRLKRQLRELTRAHMLTRAASADVLLRARPLTYTATFDALRDDVTDVTARIESLTP